ncbi:ubiquitin-activating E1 FCCH domain-containing protein [Streptomyces sp. NPDC005078]|uniref:ubiquitin-activating E1 FCCH domain-containing protein n=1 Tax=unclassified Streptomyces TaxID=2593676 RepID=UPI0033BBF674
MAERLCFPENDVVLGNPTLDGFTGIEDTGVVTTESEPGYGLGSRYVYENGSALPDVILQGVKQENKDFIHLSFFVRFDSDFAGEDVIVIALRDTFSTATHGPNCRRIDIYPVHVGIGAGPAGSTDPGDHPTVPTGWPDSSAYNIRTNRSAAAVACWKGVTAGGWASVAAPADLAVKVRSWQPPVPAGAPRENAWSVEVRIPTRSGSTGLVGDWIDLSHSFGLYTNVIRVDTALHFPGPPADGFFSNQFTWPNERTTTLPNRWLTGNLNDSTATLVTPAWYGEAIIPAYTCPPGADVCRGVKFATGASGDAWTSIGVRQAGSGTPGNQIDGTPGATNTLVALIQNDGTGPGGDAPGITAEFRLANWGLGSPDFAAWNKIATTPGPNPTAAKDVPHGTVSLELSTDWVLTAAQRAQYKGHEHQCMWVQLDSTGRGPLTVTNASNATPIEVTTSAQHRLLTGDVVVITGVVGNTAANNSTAHPEWFITVTGPTTFTLNGSSGNGAYLSGGQAVHPSTVNFAQSGVRRNMDFHSLSAVRQPAEISGVGYPPPPDGSGDHRFILRENVRRFLFYDLTGSGRGAPVDATMLQRPDTSQDDETPELRATWTWIVHGHRDTGNTLQIRGKNFRVFDQAPGTFGYVAQHDGPETDELSSGLSGGGMTQLRPGVYELSVPDGGAVTIDTIVAAGKTGCEAETNWVKRFLCLIFYWLFHRHP